MRIGEGVRFVWLALVFALVGTAFQPQSAFAQGKSILVIAPHPDDEALCCAGLIYSNLQAGNTVTVAIVTNGDDYTSPATTTAGYTREGESIAAMAGLGLSANNVIFLGYGDQSLQQLLYSSSSTQVYTSAAGQTKTYADAGLGGVSYHQYLTGSPGSYNQATILSDFEALLMNYAPTDIYTTGFWDDHPDHRSTYGFTAQALIALKQQGLLPNTRIHETWIHAPCEYCDSSYTWPEPVFTPTTPFPEPEYISQTPYNWDQIEYLPVPAVMQETNQNTNLKWNTINTYQSQTENDPSSYLFGFVKIGEFFWVRNFETNVAVLATATASSQTSGNLDGAVNAIDGIIGGSNDPLENTLDFVSYSASGGGEWVTQGELAGAWIKLTWPSSVNTSEVILYGRSDGTDIVTSGTLTFSDGSSVAVGALPVSGQGLPITFPSKTITWMQFTVNGAEGSNIGLAEIEVFGTLTGATTAFGPQMTNGPVATAGSNQTTSLTASAFDVYGYPLTYGWSVNGGSITGTGSSVSYNLPGVAGTYTGTVTVTDGHGGSVQNNTFVTVSCGLCGTISGAGGNGATVTLTGAGSATATANSLGAFDFSGLSNGSYTVTPTLTGFTFSPTSQKVTVSGGSGTANFTSSQSSSVYTISGTISGVAGATVTLTSGVTTIATITSGASGATYTFTNVPNGSYTVTPSLTGYSFSPTSAAVTVNGANATASAFTATATTYTVSGSITGAAGATVTLSLGATTVATLTSGASGSTYTFSDVANGSYTVTPSLTGYSFSPTSVAVTVNGANATASAFIATAKTYTVSGSITGAAGATVTLSLGATTVATLTSGASGSTYTFSNVANGSYTVTPSLTGYSFSPTSAAVTVNGANATASAFTASATSNGSNSNATAGISLVQENAVQGSGVASLSVAFTAANTSGNLILAFVRMSTSTQTVTLKDSAGNTYTQAVAQVQTADGSEISLFYAKNIPGAATNTVTATFSSTNNHPWLAIYEYSGLSTTSPLDKTASAQGSSTAASSGATATTTSANELVFAATGLPSSYTGTPTAGTGYAFLEKDPTGSPAANESELATSTGTYTGTFTLSASANWSALVATFAAPVGPTVTTASLSNGTENVAYSATLAATGGTQPYTWSITSGSLPTGLTLTPSTGAISGTPTGTGTSSFTVQVEDATSLTGTRSLTLTVVGPPSVSTTSLPNGAQNVAYSTTLAATGGALPYTWSITSGSLPTGLTLTPSTGAISGTPTSAGTSSFTVQVEDANSLTASKALSLTVVVAPPTVTTTSLANATQNATYSAALAAVGGTLPYTWSITLGSLPTGLTLTPNTGAISGTPTATGTTSFTAQVADANSLTSTMSLSLTVVAPPTVTTTSLPNGTQNAVYSAALAASGGTLPYTWSITTGSLPTGLTLTPGTGAISGTPTGTGTSSFTVQVADANSSIATNALSITVGSPAAGNTVSSFSDFESGTNGETATDAILNAGTYGAGAGGWTGVGSEFSVCTSGNMPTYLPVTVIGGSTYAAAEGTRGICYNLADGGYATESVNNKTVTLYVNVNFGVKANFYSNPVIIGDFGVDDAAFTINSSGELELECPFASPEDYPITGSNAAQPNTNYGVWLQYNGGGTHKIAIYSNPTTNPTLIGTASCPAQGTHNATTLGIGDFHGGADGTATIREFDSLLWDVSGNGIIVIPSAPSSPTIATTALPNATQGAAYNQTLAATGGTTPYTWSITSGSLPTGLTLTPSPGAISGTPTATGASSFTVQVAGANSLTATAPLTLTVAAPPAVATTALPNGTQNAAYSTTLSATGGTLPYTWSITSGSLPTGLTLAPSTGAISGTPTGTGTSSFTVQAADANSATAAAPLTLTVVASPIVTTTSLTNGTQNVAYSATLAATGGTQPYTWSITTGSLPTGLTLTPSTGAISGTPTGTGASTFTVQVTDASSLTGTKSLTLTIVGPLTVSTTSLTNGTQNVVYSATLAATGGTQPYTWSITTGSLPTGLTLTPSTGAISGTPTGTGASTFTVQVTDASSLTGTKSLTLTIVGPLTVSTTSLTNGTQNVAYSATLAATGGTQPYTWSITTGSLPTGLTLTPSTGAISGTPTGTGASTFTVQVTDASSLTGTKSLTLTIVGPLTVSTTSLTNGTQNVVYSATLAATGGTQPYTWSITTGSLPTGLTLTPSTGAISGTPTGTGATTFTVQVTDASSLTGSKSLTLTIVGPLTVSTTSLTNGTQNVAYSATLAATGGTQPYTWSITTGSLPTGLTLTPSTGAISGTPTGTGTSTFTVQVTDASSLTGTKSLTLTIVAPLTVSTTSLTNGTQNVAYSATLAATGGTQPYTWSITSGSLPTGLTLTPSTGAISGTPTGTGTSTFTVQVTDASSLTGTKSLTLTVVAPLSVTTTSLPAGAQNVAYSATLAATGGTLPYTWSITTGSLPTGLTLTPSTGAISGTPTATGTSTLTVHVADANSLTATKSLTLTVEVPPSVSTTSLPNGAQNVAYSATLAATGGTTPYTWSITSGSLPTGLTLTPSTGAISGTPTSTGTSSFTVQVADANSLTATKSLSVTINISAGGTIGLAQENAVQGSGVASVSVAFTAANTSGNLILAFVRMSTTTQTVTLKDSAGNTYTQAVAQVQTADGSEISLFYAKNIPGAATNTVTATFSAANNHPWLAIYEYKGLNITSPLDKTASAQGSSTAASSGATATTTSANELVFAATGLPSSYTGTPTAGSGYAFLEKNPTGSPAANESELATATGAYTGTFTLSASANWSALVATFKQ